VAIPQKDGTFRQDSLCEAFGLHGESRFFTIFREQRSNLWYIRSSKDIAERGLFAALNGYETQVFLDIQEKEDAPGARPGSWESRWAVLNYELNGRGVRSLDETLPNIFLKEIYSPVREILSKARFETLTSIFNSPKEKNPTPYSLLPTPFIESFREPVKNFEAAVEKYLDGADGKFEPWGKIGINSGGMDSGGIYSGEKSSSGKDTFGEWSLFLKNLLALTEKAGKKEHDFTRSLKKKIAERPSLLLMALGYNTLALLRSAVDDNSGKEAAALALHWQLDRILAECWESAGVPHSEARLAAEIAIALLARTGSSVSESYKTAKTPSAIAAAIILENYNESDFRKILAVNRFDDVTWFNKEAFEEALLLASFFLFLETPQAFSIKAESAAARQKRVDIIAKAVEALRNAKETSAYRLEELLGALTEK
jgi:hypothetical protein